MYMLLGKPFITIIELFKQTIRIKKNFVFFIYFFFNYFISSILHYAD